MPIFFLDFPSLPLYIKQKLKGDKMFYSKKFIVAAAVVLLGISPANASQNDSALETYNRAMFDFNLKLDRYVLKPAAKGYRAVTTKFLRERISNFFSNLREPAVMINHSLQGNFADSGKSAGRFVVNSTLGLLGTFDVASGWSMPANKTNFDKTLANWCVPDGPFFVLPLFGPSTPRAATGLAVDAVADPLYWSNQYINFGQDWKRYSFIYGLMALGFVSAREENLELVDNLTANAVDPYSMVKSAYVQNRLKIGSCATGDEQQSASYDFDFDDDDDE